MIFAISGSARKIELNRTIFVNTVFTTRNARSKEEAVGIGLELVRERWPFSDGYHGYQVEAIQIPADWIVLERKEDE